jgi:cytochrome P450
VGGDNFAASSLAALAKGRRRVEDEVDLERPRRNRGFGGSIHTCLGNRPAHLEARVVLETLPAITRAFRLHVAEPARWVSSLAVRRRDGHPLIVTPR